MKKIISVLLVAALIFSLSAVPSFAVSEEEDITEYLVSKILAFEEVIDVEKYGYTAENQGELIELVRSLRYKYASLFCFKDVTELSLNGSNVTSLTLEYNYGEKEKAFVEKYANDNFLSNIKEDWSDLEKVLYIHDTMCMAFQYDVDLYKPELSETVARDIYQMFTRGRGVCQAYSQVYQYLMEKLGIECKLIASAKANHEWNAVKLDGKWYHIDVTQDDPVIGIDASIAELDMAGSVNYGYFLVSDKNIYDKDSHGSHYNWYCLDGENVVCDSDVFYDEYDFKYSATAYAPIGDDWYFSVVNNETLEIRKTADFKKSSVEFSIPAKWDSYQENSYYPGCFTGLASKGNWLFYNTDSEIMAYNVSTKAVKTLATIEKLKERTDINFINSDTIPANVHIYGSRVLNNNIYVQISLEPADTAYYTAEFDICDYGHIEETGFIVTTKPSKENSGTKENRCKVCGDLIETENIPPLGDTLAGDCNNDGEIDAADLALLKKYIAGLTSEGTGFDCNSDGYVNATDLALLKKFIAGLISSFV